MRSHGDAFFSAAMPACFLSSPLSSRVFSLELCVLSRAGPLFPLRAENANVFVSPPSPSLDDHRFRPMRIAFFPFGQAFIGLKVGLREDKSLTDLFPIHRTISSSLQE